MKPLKVGILGHGNAAAKHRTAYAELPELWEVVDRLKEPAGVTDVCSPSGTHYEFATQMMAMAGTRVILEKPPCGSLYEMDSLARYVAYTHQRIFPIFQLDTDATDVTLHWKRDDAYWAGWRGKWDTALGGCLTTHGIHALHALNRNHGPFKEVSCVIGTRTFDIEVEDFACVGLISAYQDDDDVALDIQIDRVGGPSTDLGDSHEGYVRQFRELHKRLTAPRQGSTNLFFVSAMVEARQTMELLTACYYSAYTGEPVTLPIERGHPFYDGWQQQMKERDPPA